MSIFGNFSEEYTLIQKFFRVRDRTEFEVRSFYLNKGYSTQFIDEIITDMKEKNLINDSKFLSNYIYSHQTLKRKSQKLVTLELEELGIDKTLLSNINWDKNVELENCKWWVIKKISSKNPDKKIVLNCMQSLVSKGFDLELIESNIKEFGIDIERIIENE
ncbi:MAG: RecX family transcriptional regulator [Leptospiraceae bacterium]|nr:RecX family transcriptional regulator [Leptospiraceae bacterium]